MSMLRTRLLVLALCLGTLVGPAPALAVPPPPLHAEGGLARALDAMARLAPAGRAGGRKLPVSGRPIDYGRDGRFTILLMGSDWRRNAGGERIDVVLVMSIDPQTGRVASVGIPRDMVKIPRARQNGRGTSGGLRVNSIYYISYRDPALPHEALDRRALSRFMLDVGALLGVEIDGWALARFNGFSRAISLLGGIDLDIRDAIIDPYYHSGRFHGIHFPARRDYRLQGNPECRPYPRKCRSALAYARSRKGTEGDRPNNDYRRVARHPRIVMAAVGRVVEDHGAGLALALLMWRLRQHVATSLPATPAAVAQLYDLLKDARLVPADIVVVGPSTYAYTDESTALYTYRPNLRAIRRWVDRHLYPVKPVEAE